MVTSISREVSKASTVAYEKSIKQNVIELLVRECSIVSHDTKSSQQIITSLPFFKYEKLSKMLGIPSRTIRIEAEQFFRLITYFKRFLASGMISWEHTPSRLYRKMRIYLHKLHRICPVFDYRRARVNLERLHSALWDGVFWPQLSTQLAIIMYVTDINDKRDGKRILQKNIRSICHCSAYAFHRTRNILHIK